MALGIVGRKIGMTRVFNAEGKAAPVTVGEVATNRVTQLKSLATDGYVAVQATAGGGRAERPVHPGLCRLPRYRRAPA